MRSYAVWTRRDCCAERPDRRPENSNWRQQRAKSCPKQPDDAQKVAGQSATVPTAVKALVAVMRFAKALNPVGP